MHRFALPSRPSRSRRAGWIALALALSASGARLAAQGTPIPASQAPPGAPVAACTVREVSRSPLVIGGSREMYVEPTALLPSRGEILIAGTPTYLFAPGRAGDARDFVEDSALGAIVDAEGRARLLPAPFDAKRITHVRGVVLDDGTWALAFAELKHATTPPEPDTIVRFWYGVFDGKTWRQLEPLPIPGDGELLTAGSSNLLVSGNSAYLSVVRARPSGRFDIALFERQRGRWTVSFPQVRGVAYTLLTFSDSGHLMLGVIRADTGRGYDANSMFFQTRRRGEWSDAQKLVQGYPEPVHLPRIVKSGRGGVLTWQALKPGGERVARAIVGQLDPGTPVITLDTLVAVAVQVLGRPDSPIWVTDHRGSDTGSRIHILGLRADAEAVLLSSLPNPYTGAFAASATGTDAFIIAGPLLRPEPPNPSLVTLFIRNRVECAPRAP